MFFININNYNFAISNSKKLIDMTKYIEISEEQYNEIQEKQNQGYEAVFTISGNDLSVTYKEPVVDSKQAYKTEMDAIKQWLNDNDYIINKHVLGEYTDTDTRWLNYLAERKAKLERYNELEVLLNGN